MCSVHSHTWEVFVVIVCDAIASCTWWRHHSRARTHLGIVRRYAEEAISILNKILHFLSRESWTSTTCKSMKDIHNYETINYISAFLWLRNTWTSLPTYQLEQQQGRTTNCLSPRVGLKRLRHQRRHRGLCSFLQTANRIPEDHYWINDWNINKDNQTCMPACGFTTTTTSTMSSQPLQLSTNGCAQTWTSLRTHWLEHHRWQLNNTQLCERFTSDMRMISRRQLHERCCNENTELTNIHWVTTGKACRKILN